MSYAGDLTPEQAWELLRENPDAVLVDVRTDAEWKYVGVPDVSSLGKQAALIEWVSHPTGARNDNFVDQLKEAGITADSS
ncbi:MAG: rhodanese-like domain-containing protein, partial [Rhodococcus sp. (in: high G+C Gram-positive bacteria)]